MTERPTPETQAPGGGLTDWLSSLEPTEPHPGSAGYWDNGQFLTLSALRNVAAEKAQVVEAEVKGLRELAHTVLVDWLSPKPLADLGKSWPAMKALADYFHEMDRHAARARARKAEEEADD